MKREEETRRDKKERREETSFRAKGINEWMK